MINSQVWMQRLHDFCLLYICMTAFLKKFIKWEKNRITTTAAAAVNN